MSVIPLPEGFSLDWPPNEGANKMAHIDGDIIAYHCAYASEGEPIEYALKTVKEFTRDIIRRSGCDSWIVHLTGVDKTKQFRYSVATIQPYKGNRAGKEKPEHYQEVRDYLCEYWNGFIHPVIEADDGMSIASYYSQCPLAPQYKGLSPVLPPHIEHVICSIDKDLRGVRGALLFDWREEHGPTLQEPLDAARWFYTQVLTGDSVDHIKGLSLTREESKILKAKSIGPKAHAVQALQDVQSESAMYERVLEEYCNRDLVLYKHSKSLTQPLLIHYELGPEMALLENAKLLHMLRWPGEVWSPPQ